MTTRWVTSLTLVLLSILLAAVPMATLARAQDGDPILVVPGGAVDGVIAVDPPLQRVDAGASIRWTLRNGGADAALELTIVDITVDATGAVTPGPRRLDLAPPSSLTLREGEVGRVSVDVPAETPDGVVALVARTEGTNPEVEVAGIVTIGALPAAEVAIAQVDPGDGAVVIDIGAEATTVVDVAVRVRAWPGVDAGVDPRPRTDPDGDVDDGGGLGADVDDDGPVAGIDLRDGDLRGREGTDGDDARDLDLRVGAFGARDEGDDPVGRLGRHVDGDPAHLALTQGQRRRWREVQATGTGGDRTGGIDRDVHDRELERGVGPAVAERPADGRPRVDPLQWGVHGDHAVDGATWDHEDRVSVLGPGEGGHRHRGEEDRQEHEGEGGHPARRHRDPRRSWPGQPRDRCGLRCPA